MNSLKLTFAVMRPCYRLSPKGVSSIGKI